MTKQHYNLLIKRVKGQEYLISDFIATKLNKTQFEKLKNLNPILLGDYVFCDYEETDFSWWCKVNKYLTNTKLQKSVYFDIDFNGNIIKY